MTKLNKPTGLIRYDSENGLNRHDTHLLRPRLLIYLGIITLLISLLVHLVSTRDLAPIHFRADRQTPYQQIDSQHLLNHFEITLRNQYLQPITVDLQLPASLSKQGFKLTMPAAPIHIKADGSITHQLFILYPIKHLQHGKIQLPLHQIIQLPHQPPIIKEKEIQLIGPL